MMRDFYVFQAQEHSPRVIPAVVLHSIFLVGQFLRVGTIVNGVLKLVGQRLGLEIGGKSVQRLVVGGGGGDGVGHHSLRLYL